jgi:hypothetical protein
MRTYLRLDPAKSDTCSKLLLSLHSRNAADLQILYPTTDSDMPDPRNINAWMGHCGGTDPYCQQGCSPTCANYSYMTGFEISSARKGSSADTLVGRFGARGEDQPRVGQRAVQEAMRKVQEGPTRTRTQNILPQHQGRVRGRTPTTFEKSKIGSISVVTPTSLGGKVSDEQPSSSNIILPQQNVMSSTPHTVPENVVADEDEDAEYEIDQQQKRSWIDAPRGPPGPVQGRGSWTCPN